MTRKTMTILARIASLIFVSFFIGNAMTRFTYIWAPAIPDWIADTVRASYEGLGYQGAGIEDIMDGDILGRLSACWFLAMLFMWMCRRSTRNVVPRTSWFLAYVVVGFAGAYVIADRICQAMFEPWNERPNDFQVLYVSGLLMMCWIGMIFVLRPLLAAMGRISSRPHRQ
jgi:hypothetical protein